MQLSSSAAGQLSYNFPRPFTGEGVRRTGEGKKAAFTLAEVLITLGIVGVVAAMTIPSLMNTYKAHRLRAQFLKSYSTVQQVFKQMEADDVSLNPTDYNDNNYGPFYKTFNKYLKASVDCGSCTTKFNPSKMCYNYKKNSGDMPYKNLNGTAVVAPTLFDDGQILLPDGTLLLFENPSNVTNPRVWVHIDLNGYKNPPNRWGYDLFTFNFLDGELRTMGELQTGYTRYENYCSLTSTMGYNGIACAYKAKSNPDYFKWVVKNVK